MRLAGVISKPQVIIPMSGTGKRFVDAGFYHLKPLIPIANSRIIFEVMSMFPGVDDPLFIISKDHKQKLELIKYLNDNWPKSVISEIPSHKFGPGYAIHESQNYIDKERPVIVSYCDFSGNWDFEEFCKELIEVDSLILTYTGFHPHMLRNTKYAYVRKDLDGFVKEIQEKNSFTDFPMTEEASAGLYAFSSGGLLLEALSEQINMNYSHFGEYYISLTIVPLLERGLKVRTFLMEKFAQFGTPEDLNDWNYLYKSIHEQEFKNLEISNKAKNDETSVILAGGIGSRLTDFTQIPKPFIKIKGKELWQISNSAVSQAANKYIILRKEFASYLGKINDTEAVLLEKPTQGQADTARYALGKIKSNSGPLTFLSCDNVINQIDYENSIKLLKESDLIVWTSTGYPMARYKPSRYSWINIENSRVTGFSLKNLPPNFSHPSMIIGNFTFKNSGLAKELIDECFKSADRYSSEIYLDSVIQIALEFGYDVSAINLERFFAIGTEDEINTYNYYLDLKMSENLHF
jgi:NDP-sugar pyrophosphorylase family protein